MKHFNPLSVGCVYKNNKNAWLTRDLFSNWLGTLNDTLDLLGRNICVIMDNFSGHVVTSSYSRIKLVYLRPGLTSVLQPLDCGIIRSFKAHYSSKLVSLSLLSDTGDVKAPEVATDLPSNPRKISVRDAIIMASEAWNAVTKPTIINCWRKADIV